MVKNSLGLIEVVGLAAALEAADAAVKAANVELIGYENAKGGGLILIKICGDVGAVKAGVEAGSAAARKKVNKVWSTHVIPRPHQQLSCILAAEEIKKSPIPIVVTDSQVIGNEDEIIEEPELQPELPVDTETEEEVEAKDQVDEEDDDGEEQVIETSSSEESHESSEDHGVIVVDQSENNKLIYAIFAMTLLVIGRKVTPKSLVSTMEEIIKK